MKRSILKTINQLFQENIEQILKLVSIYMYVYDEHGKILDANNVFINAIKFSKEELLNMNIRDLISHKDHKIDRESIISPLSFEKQGETQMAVLRTKNDMDLFIQEIKIPLNNHRGIRCTMVIGHNITEFVNAQQKLKESETRYRTAINSLPFDFFELDKNERYIMQNSTCNEHWGDVVGKTPSEVTNDEKILEIWRDNNRRAFLGETVEGEVYFIINNEPHYLYNIISPIRSNQDIQGILGVNIDITKQKVAEQRLKESEERYRNIIEGAQETIYRMALPKGNYEYVSPAAQLVFGYPAEKFIENPLFIKEILHSDFQDYFKERWNELDKGIIPATYEYKIIGPTGSERWIMQSNRGIFDDSGTLIAIEGICRDISARKITEQRLKESEEKYRLLFEKSPNAIVLLNVDGTILDCNLATENIFGYTIEELIGQNYLRLSYYPDETIQALKERFAQSISKKQDPEPREMEIIAKNGEKIWVKLTTTYTRLGEHDYLQAIIEDVSERKKAENLIIEENKKLLGLDNLRRDIITRVSHELKTPLTSLYGSIHFLRLTYLDEKESNAQEFATIAFNSIERLNELVFNLLESLRLEDNKYELTLESTNISDIVKKSVMELMPMARIRNQKVELDLNQNTIFKIDKLRFSQAISNMVSNAIKNTPSGGSICISLSENDAYMDIIVKDTGVGITEEEEKLLFKKFGKIERYGKDLDVDIEGSGLGLYLSEEIVKMHGGKILMESEGRGKGSTFTIRLNKHI